MLSPRILPDTCYFTVLDPDLDVEFTLDELITSIDNLKHNKAVGLDSIPNECFKYLSSKWIHYLLRVFNTVWLNECLRKIGSK